MLSEWIAKGQFSPVTSIGARRPMAADVPDINARIGALQIPVELLYPARDEDQCQA
jgi:hypothetical protein